MTRMEAVGAYGVLGLQLAASLVAACIWGSGSGRLGVVLGLLLALIPATGIAVLAAQ